MPVLGKALMPVETNFSGVFQYENPILIKNPWSQNHVRDPFKPMESIRGISKYYVIPWYAGFKITDHIDMHRFNIGEAYFFNGSFNPGKILTVHLNQVHLGPSRSEFKTDAACSWKKIQNCYRFKIYPVIEYIEQTLPCKIRCWSGFQTPGRNNYPSFVFASDYSQFITVNRL